MKRSSVAGAVLTSIFAGSAIAADLPAKAPVYAAPFSWTGFYVGAHVGWGWGTGKWSNDCMLDALGACRIEKGPEPASSYSLNGFLGGGQIGYNWQSGWAVFGVEADASGTDIKGSGDCIRGRQCISKIDALGTITGRFGGAVDHALVYVKGGSAWARRHDTVSVLGDEDDASFISQSWSQTKWGWTVGGGVEYAFAPNWSGKIEHNFLDFGKDTVALREPFLLWVQADVQQVIHTVKLGVNYRFGGPVAARY